MDLGGCSERNAALTLTSIGQQQQYQRTGGVALKSHNHALGGATLPPAWVIVSERDGGVIVKTAATDTLGVDGRNSAKHLEQQQQQHVIGGPGDRADQRTDNCVYREIVQMPFVSTAASAIDDGNYTQSKTNSQYYIVM